MEQILRKFPEILGGTEHVQTVCTRLFFLYSCMRAWEQGYFARMTTGAFSQNVSKLFSELKLVTENLLIHV